MFNFHLYNGSWTTRVFVALTVALCIWSILTMTGNAMTGEVNAGEVNVGEVTVQDTVLGNQEVHMHQGDVISGGECYAAICHEHSGSKNSGGGCYTEAVKHAHSGSAELGGGCYGQGIFHVHSGSSSQGGGCYGSAVTHNHSGSSSQGGGCYGSTIYHTHTGDETSGGPCFATPVYHQHQGESGTSVANGCYTQAMNVNVGKVCGIFCDQGDDTWKCNGCGWVIPDWNLPYDRQHWPQIIETRYGLGCGKTEETVDGYALSCQRLEEDIDGYALSCGKNTNTVEGYRLSCGKEEFTVDAYGLNCGYGEGQIERYKRACGMTSETIVGYQLICGFESLEGKASTQDNEGVQQPVKVPLGSEEIGNEEIENEEIERGDTEFIATEAGDPEPEMVEEVLSMGMFTEDNLGLQGNFTATDKKEIDVEANREVGSASEVSKEMAVLNSGGMTVGLKKVGEGAAGIAIIGLLCVACMFGIWLYFKKTVALFYYDETNHYHSLGRIRFQRTQKGYHVEIGNGIRSKATTDRYRIRATKDMQKASEKQHLYVKISTQIMKLRLEEYVDFAL